jgi:hypothetical protein
VLVPVVVVPVVPVVVVVAVVGVVVLAVPGVLMSGVGDHGGQVPSGSASGHRRYPT